MKTTLKSQPNFLLFLVDEQRFPPPYETADLQTFRKENLTMQETLRQQGVELRRHYTASSACAPSRASIFTGHYPSLHGVTQTDGVAKHPADPEMFWLAPDSVPTMGDYFRTAGYRTFYKGKWHISHADLLASGSEEAFATYDAQSQPIPSAIAQYEQANPLSAYGFDGWIGPEPHGRAQTNSGFVRDAGYAQQTIDLLDQLQAAAQTSQAEQQPWLIVSSYVNPHDIVLLGPLWREFGFPTGDESVPIVPAPPTRGEELTSKPRCQQSYLDTYGRMLLPQPTTSQYYQFYYYLHKLVDAEIQRVYTRLQNSPFFDNTIVIFTSDHGDLLGAHGGMHQKWHNAYEETVHVPCLFANPHLLPQGASCDVLSSHVDLIPTMLGLAGVDVNEVQRRLAQDHQVVRPLVGADLSNLLLGEERPVDEQAIYFMTDDEISEGQNHERPWGTFEPVVQPNHVETVVAQLQTPAGTQLWKYSRYFDNPQFWSTPHVQDQVVSDGVVSSRYTPENDEYELYDLLNDPHETNNLANTSDSDPNLAATRRWLDRLLHEQRVQKRLVV